MDTAQSQSSPMVVQSLDLNNDDIRLCDEWEKCLDYIWQEHVH